MKKLFIMMIIALLMIGCGAGYYVFFMQNQTDQPVAVTPAELESVITPPATLPKTLPTEPVEERYYVVERRLPVFSHPNEKGLLVDTLYKGEQITVLEKTDTFGRISDYLVFSEQEEPVAEWVMLSGLSDRAPEIDEVERLEILDGYLYQSDDLKQYQDVFRDALQGLLDNGYCQPEDFQELSGWVRSVTFSEEPVYFIYCGGLSRDDKVYLNAYNAEIFTLESDGKSRIRINY